MRANGAASSFTSAAVTFVAIDMDRDTRSQQGRSLQQACGCQRAELMAAGKTGLTCANMLRAFQVGKALTSDVGPSS